MSAEKFDAKGEAIEVEEAYRRYNKAYPQQVLTDSGPIDFDSLDFWSFPLLIVRCSQSAIVVVERADFDASFRAMYDGYRRDGWAGRADLDSVRVHSLRPGLAVLEGKGTRYRADNSILDTWDTFYVLRKTNGVWRTFMITDSIQARPTAEQWTAWARALGR